MYCKRNGRNYRDETKRARLGDHLGQRKRWRAVCSSVPSRAKLNSKGEHRICFEEVRFANTGNPAANHVWMNYTPGFQKFDPVPGDIIEFDARVTSYIKPGGDEDYTLVYPRNPKKIGHDNKFRYHSKDMNNRIPFGNRQIYGLIRT